MHYHVLMVYVGVFGGIFDASFAHAIIFYACTVPQATAA